MTPSLKGGYLPESPQDYIALTTTPGALRYTKCCDCKQPFTQLNVKSLLGWRETQISGMCETCFDKLFQEPSK